MPRVAKVLPAEMLAFPSLFMHASSEGRFTIPTHVAMLEDYVLAAIERGARTQKTQLLTVEMPVRHAKSTYASWHLPSWYLGSHPHKNVGLASYEHRFAAGWGGKSRDTLEEFGPSFGVRVDPFNRARDWWEIARHGGSMRSFGVGGSITGKGFDLFIVDDPIKNQQEADSETTRNEHKEWLRATVLTRLEPGAVLILMMARWHEDDLIGWVHREGIEGRWQRLRIPAIAEADDDALGRLIGEPLWPERVPLVNLEQSRADVGERWFNALYQQRPSPPAGAIFKRGDWQFYPRPMYPREFELCVQSWDMSFKDTKSGSYVVGQVWGRRGADFYLLAQVRDRMDFPTTLAAVKQWAAHSDWGRVPRKLVEEKANGAAIISTLRRSVPGLIAVTPKESKEARAHAVSSYVESHNVFLPDPSIALWIGEFIEEHSAFPTGLHDDQVDCHTQAVSDLVKTQVGRVGRLGASRRAA